MKKLILLSFIALMMSCKKEETEPVKQQVMYTVKCIYCTVDVVDNVNTQTFQVNGNWSYTFINTKLDSASLTIRVEPSIGNQLVTASIRSGLDRSTLLNENMPISGNVTNRLTLSLK